MKIAFVTYDDQGKYASDVENEDARLLQYLQTKGLDIHLEIWTDPQANWQSYDLAILKSPWDYFDKIDQFYQWLDLLNKLPLPLLNPYPVVRWNSDKHYLADIAARGLAVTPSLFLERGAQVDLLACFDKFSAEKIILKPCISGGSKNTFAITRQDIAKTEALLQPLLQKEAFVVQPFLPQIQEEGEWSFIFFNGQFSHSLLKKARPGDFRVQHYLGGTIHPGEAPAHLLLQAKAYVEQFAGGCLYARVDGVVINKQFVLMELELVEPFLFLFTHADSYENYYQALIKLM